jgi:outer membrane protein TolC
MTASLRRAGAFALSLAALAPCAAAAQSTPAAAPPSLTVEQAVAIARENNPDLLSTANDLRTARYAVRAARADFIPGASASTSFGYTAAGQQRIGAQSFGQGPAYLSSDYQLGLNYEMSGSKLLQPAVARAQQHATVQRIAGADASLVGQVVQQYLSVLQAQEQVSQAEREVGRTAEHQRLAQARLDVGAGTALDLRQAEVAKGQADVKLLQQRANLSGQRMRLAQVMGVPMTADTKLVSTFQLFEPKWSPDSLVALAVRRNPTVVSYRADVEAARVQVRSARSAYLPSVGMTAGFRGSVYSASNIGPLLAVEKERTASTFQSCNTGNRLAALINEPLSDCSIFDVSNPAVISRLRGALNDENPSFPFGYTRQPFGASLQFSLPIFNGLQREQRVEQARVAAEDAQYRVRSQEQKLTADIGVATLDLRTAFETAQLQEQVKQKAAEELRLAQERFRYGAANSIDVTDAQTSLAQAEQAQIDAVYIFHKSLAALEALIGQPLR